MATALCRPPPRRAPPQQRRRRPPVPRAVLAGAAAARRVAHVLRADGTGTVTARAQPEAVHAADPLASIDGVTNAVVCRARPTGQVTIIGPGAGPQLVGKGVLSDVIAVARWQARNSETAV